MKSKLFIFAFLLFNSSLVFSQLCTPDTTYAHEEGNIYPEAFHARLNPDKGTLDSACINTDYSFVFTAVVPDSLPTAFGVLKLDSLVITANGVLDIPKGLKYKCNPPNCKFDQGTIGCMELYGKPELNNEIKVYDLKLKVKISVEDGFIVVNDTLPKYLSDSAHYFLPLFPEGSANCNPTSVIEYNNSFSVKISPNPVVDRINIEMNTFESGTVTYSLINIHGKQLLKKEKWVSKNGEIFYEDISNLKNGIYFLKTKYKNRIITKKITIL